MTDYLASRLDNVRFAILRTHDKSANKKAAKIDGLLVSDIVNVGYVSGFTGSSAVALIMPDKAYLITDSRYTIRARAECPHFEVVISQLSASTIDELVRVLGSYKPSSRIGFETSVSYAQLKAWKSKAPNSLRWRPANGIVERLRAVKDAGEIDAIRRAVAIAEQAFDDVAGHLLAGTTEREYALELDTAMRRRGADRVSFDTIVASGENGANPHYTPADRAFESGDLVTIDWGAEINGYCSDLTRTVLIPGKAATESQIKVHDIVLKAKELATAAIAPGLTGKAIDAIARDYIASHGYGDNFGHSLGHALGRVVHDGPALSSRSDVVLTSGMVVTVEPGIYIEGWGGVRIEEDVLVTATGAEVLSKPSGPLATSAGKKPARRKAPKD
ncbi:MAG TPA: aminopeptidase P family protein [Capsulimonadaceae bacterium]|jgi:Xaa-Pro aminopeptidase